MDYSCFSVMSVYTSHAVFDGVCDLAGVCVCQAIAVLSLFFFSLILSLPPSGGQFSFIPKFFTMLCNALMADLMSAVPSVFAIIFAMRHLLCSL